MTKAAVRILLALVFFAAGAVCWREAQLTRRLADAHLRRATLHYDGEDDIDSALSVWNRLPWAVLSHSDEVRLHRATVSYWSTDYNSLADTTAAAETAVFDDPQLL